MQLAGGIPDIHELVVDSSGLDEGTLAEEVALVMKLMADGGNITDEQAAASTVNVIEDGISSEEEDAAAHAVNLLWFGCSEEAEGDLAGWLSTHIDPAPPPLSATAEDVPGQCKKKPSGRYILAGHRADEKDGLSREITQAPKPKITYRVSGWVSVQGAASCTDGGHAVHVEVRTGDGSAIGSGVVLAEEGKWAEIKGAFRVDEHPRGAEVYVHGPPAGVDIKVMDLRVCAVNRIARLRHLRKKTDKVRKRDVVLKFKQRSEDGANDDDAAAVRVNGASIRVVQVDNAVPIGACISKSAVQNPAFVDFFANHFDWAVLENELKWYYTEAVQGQVNYADADALIALCDRHKKPVRGHRIFRAVENSVQPWVRASNPGQLKAAVESRIKSLVSRYSGRFPCYEVNNEMLHGSFFRQRLGDDIDAHMFRETAAIDPAPALFVNDYNVENANDPNATPEKYVALITDLQKRGASVGGIGVQGHVTHPVGDVICDALDKLAATELPVWITELDVSAADEAMRADDLETVLREAFAHPAVEGIMLWGFMQGHMWRANGQLLNADGSLSEAGHRSVGLRTEWTSHARGTVDANGNFKFRGFHGKYVLELAAGAGGKVRRAFDVHKGDAPLVLDMNL
ncbi:endo-1,4-beta-xylanase 1-like [Lolium rigidum]|uniref:endo-1,4-beta-xylanase 1-like n=1 Tax=Lolium rigidum TaxID=89674 RepID=UPI001F5CC6DF|nr:endo-1,4-beta-xylanase 1-like [Lolium rigidum]